MNTSNNYLLIIVALFVVSSTTIFSQQTFLHIINPHTNQGTANPTMDSLTVIIKPSGSYTQISYLINISTTGTIFDKLTDSVEIVSYFTLPVTAIVDDSWLWVDDTLVYAQLIDRWSALNIYEDIVKRQKRDPSIFFKNSKTNYEFRIYPLVGTKHRKFLFSILIPNMVSNDRLSFEVPIIWLDKVIQPKEVNVIFHDEISYSDINQLIPEGVGEFVESQSDFFGKHYKRTMSPTEFYANNKFSYKAPIKNGVFINTFDSGNEKFYSMNFNKGDVMPVGNTKHLIAFEYVPKGTDKSLQTILNQLSNSIEKIYIDGDSINIAYHTKYGKAKFISDTLIGISSENIPVIKELINSISYDVANESTLPSLINFVTDSLKNYDSTTSIVIVANSDMLHDTRIANPLLNEITSKTKYKTRYFSIDYRDTPTNNRIKVNGLTYHGNHYFFDNLARLTKGDYSIILHYNNDFYVSYSKLINSFRSIQEEFNVSISSEDGFTYQNFILKDSLNDGDYFNVVGKFTGSEKFNVRYSCIFNNIPYLKIVQIDPKDIIRNVRLNQIWGGNYIKSMENDKNLNNYTILKIIDASLSNHVLSQYTAFLALEPWMHRVVFGDGNQNENNPISDVDENEMFSDELSISVNPNPVSESTKITISSEKDVYVNSIEIYDLTGKIIRHLDIPLYSIKGDYHIFWDLLDDYGNRIQNGTYFIIVNIGLKSYTYKIIVNH